MLRRDATAAEAPADGAPSAWKSFFADSSRVQGQLIPAVLLVGGIVAVILGWYGTARSNILTVQIPYLVSGGILGLGLIVAAGVVASSASQREAREMGRRVADALEALREWTPPEAPAAGSPTTNGRVLVLAEGRSYHTPGCPIIEGREGVRELQVRQAVRAGYSACKLCTRD
jgi:hypothetical protein